MYSHLLPLSSTLDCAIAPLFPRRVLVPVFTLPPLEPGCGRACAASTIGSVCETVNGKELFSYLHLLLPVVREVTLRSGGLGERGSSVTFGQ